MKCLAIDPEQPIYDVSAMVDVVSRSVFLPRISMLLLGAFALTALLLAVVGIYGVVSYSVTQRTRELGVRMALGAATADTLRLVLGRSLRLVAVGTACGLVASVAVTRVMSGLLYDVSPLDPVVFAGESRRWPRPAWSRASSPRAGPRASIRWWRCGSSSRV